MESLEYIFNTYGSSDINQLSTETPIGWSSICLDQTINYYIDHDPTFVESTKSKDIESAEN